MLRFTTTVSHKFNIPISCSFLVVPQDLRKNGVKAREPSGLVVCEAHDLCTLW